MTDDPLADRTVLVTGATSGIGRETVRRLAADGARVFVHGRDRERGERVCETVDRETPGSAAFLAADFADPDAVRELGDAVLAGTDDLHAVVNNAGTWRGERELSAYTASGAAGPGGPVELTVAVNHCAHYLLTAELWDALAHGDGGRVVTVSSDLHRRADFDLGAFVGPDGPTGQRAYAHSKLATVLFARELARRAPDRVVSTACHPGVVPSTALARDASSPAALGWRLFGLLGRCLPVGPVDTEHAAADTQYFLASAPEADALDGAYVVDRDRVEPSAAARDREAARRLWDWTAEAVGVDPAFPS